MKETVEMEDTLRDEGPVRRGGSSNVRCACFMCTGHKTSTEAWLCKTCREYSGRHMAGHVTSVWICCFIALINEFGNLKGFFFVKYNFGFSCGIRVFIFWRSIDFNWNHLLSFDVIRP